MADQLVTSAQVKARILRPGDTDVVDDTLISELIDQVTDWIQDYTGRHFITEPATTYYVDTAPGSVIEVRRGIQSVTTLSIASVDSPDDGSGAYTAIAAADVLLRPSSIERRPGWPATRILLRNASVGRLVAALNGAKIVGTFGWATVPPEIQSVALDAIVAAYQARGVGASGVIGADEVAVTPWSSFFGRGSPQRSTLDRFRQVGFA